MLRDFTIANLISYSRSSVARVYVQLLSLGVKIRWKRKFYREQTLQTNVPISASPIYYMNPTYILILSILCRHCICRLRIKRCYMPSEYQICLILFLVFWYFCILFAKTIGVLIYTLVISY